MISTTNEIKKVKDVAHSAVSKIEKIEDWKLNDRMSQIELNEEITEDQCEMIRKVVNKRVAEILHRNPQEMAKYFRSFILKCYSEARRYGLGASYRRTKKCNYQNVIDKIESWIPSIGISNLKHEIDIRAMAKRNAQKNGY
jgi:hypothetical protein